MALAPPPTQRDTTHPLKAPQGLSGHIMLQNMVTRVKRRIRELPVHFQFGLQNMPASRLGHAHDFVYNFVLFFGALAL